jgi:hypothetical protein
MPKPTLLLALIAATAIVAGLAVGFFELTIIGIIAAVVAVTLWLRSVRSARNLNLPRQG